MTRVLIATGIATLLLAGCTPNEQDNSRRAAVQAPSPADGKTIFQSTCSFCHGIDGKGNTPIAAGYPNANLADGVWAYGGNREQIIQTITRGVPGTPMRGFQGSLNPAEIGAVADYVHSLPAAPTATAPPATN
ncbi:MAG: c-type cytochrome [Thermoanaerobaculia bacterium]